MATISKSLLFAGLLAPAVSDVSFRVASEEASVNGSSSKAQLSGLGLDTPAVVGTVLAGEPFEEVVEVAEKDVGAKEDSDLEGAAYGTILAFAGGTGYALGALLVSWATRQAASEQGLAEKCEKCLKFLAWNIMNVGGLCVTFSYQSGASVPLMNAVVYSTNLFLNMIFQMTFKLTPYTKNMRCGTILFALAALQLGQIAPPPQDGTLDQLTQPSAIAWLIVFGLVWIWTFFELRATEFFPTNNSRKIFAWALHVACWGSFTDNWAKMNGALDGIWYWVVFIPYLPTGMWVMVISVWAMAGCNVAVYVPTNLCIQLCMNTISAFAIWSEAERVEYLVAYVVGYVVCCFAVYVASEELDIGASFSNSQEMKTKSLSQGKAATPFGESLIALANFWKNKQESGATPWLPIESWEEEEAIKEEGQQAIQNALMKGADTKAFTQANLVELVLHLWERTSPRFGPIRVVVEWMQQTPYFEDYLAADPQFSQQLTAALPPDERMSMRADKASVEMPEV